MSAAIKQGRTDNKENIDINKDPLSKQADKAFRTFMQKHTENKQNNATTVITNEKQKVMLIQDQEKKAVPSRAQTSNEPKHIYRT